MEEKHPTVYLMANRKYGTLYLGVTSNPIQRIWQHKEGLTEGFTKRYNIKILVWLECHQTMYLAISREKELKKWRRDWKIQLIEAMNPGWKDLYADLLR